MRTRASQALALLAALHLLGGHWVALQSVAWVTMVVDYSQEGSLGEALGKTFDGEHPCPLCKAVAEGRGEEQDRKDDLVDPGFKWLATLVREAAPVPRRERPLSYFPAVNSLHSVDDSRPEPPPRAA